MQKKAEPVADQDELLVTLIDHILAKQDPIAFVATLVAKVSEAKKQASLGYEFNGTSYSYHAMVACGHAERLLAGIARLLPAPKMKGRS